MGKDADQFVDRMKGECRARNPDVFEIVRCTAKVDHAHEVEKLLLNAIEKS